MVQVLLTRSIAIAVLVTTFGGCLDGPDSVIGPFVIGEPHAFSALVRSPFTDSLGYMNLSGPVQIANRDGSLVDAYVYEQAIPHEGEYQRLWYYLDGDLRRIVDVLGCGYTMFSCQQYRDWSWNDQGQPGPDGLGYPDLIAVGDFVAKSGGHETPIPWNATVDGEGRLVLTFERPWSKGEPLAYRYVQGRALPDGSRFTVERFEDNGPLAPIAALPLPTPPLPPHPWEGLMFPGENEDSFGVGATHAEIARFAFSDLDQDEDLCIQNYEIQPRVSNESGGDGLPLPLPTYGNELSALARVSAIHGTSTTEVQVQVYRNGLNGSISMAKVTGQSETARFSCSEMYLSPWPQTDLDTARGTAATLVDARDVGIFTHEIGFKERFQGQAPTHGWHTYRFDFIPEWAQDGTGVYDMYWVVFESSGPLLAVAALGPPDATYER